MFHGCSISLPLLPSGAPRQRGAATVDAEPATSVRRPTNTRRTALRAGAPRRAMTLVEMLVAMALSLIVILAVTQAFRLVGDNVLASRAVSEMSGQLRACSNQLRRDLSALTVPVRPWTDATSGQGYFEIVEGPFWDLGLGPQAAGAPPVPPADPLNPRPIPWFSETSAGDIDDVLMFTARASEGEPFIGQVLGTVTAGSGNTLTLSYDPANPVRSIIQSNIAEIAWFTRFNDWNGNNRPDPGEVTLHRRTFLVLPNLDIFSDPDIQALTPGQFYGAFDLSVRYVDVGGTFRKITNSLQTLSIRQNRTAHHISGGMPIDPSSGAATWLAQSFPHPLSRALLIPKGTVLVPDDTPADGGSWGAAGVDDDGDGASDNGLREAGTFGSDDLTLPTDAVFSQPWAIRHGEAFGSDVILSQILAFDVKVFDPEVPIQRVLAAPSSPSVPASPEGVLPGDPGYQLDPSGNLTMSRGGYVDLFYARYVPGAAGASPPPPSIASTFAGAPLARSGYTGTATVWGIGLPAAQTAFYDTWTMFYEHDGVDQDGAFGADQGTNGFDDPDPASGTPENGVDDVRERETSPPYPAPLRGLQVRIRIIDPDSRQVRQVTVSSDFLPE